MVLTPPRNRKQTEWATVSPRADGSAWRLPLLTISGAEPGPTLVVTAGVHGDEYEGVETIAQLYQQLAPQDLRGDLILVPVCNLPAYEAIQRSSPIDGLNLARTFPGNAKGTVTERIAHWMTEQLLRRADFYIDLHSGGIAADIPTLVGYIHDDGELGQHSRAAAEAFGAPVLWGHPLPLPPGRTISAATELGVPSLYTEAPGGGYARPADVDLFVRGVRNVMCHLGMMYCGCDGNRSFYLAENSDSHSEHSIDSVPDPQTCTHDLFGDGNLDVVVAAPVAGYFRAAVTLLDGVVAGQCLGAIYDFTGEQLAEVISQRDGVVIMLRRLHRVNVGDGVAQVTGWRTDRQNH